MAQPKYRGSFKGQTVGFYRWNGFMWVDNRTSSFTSDGGSGGMPYVNFPELGNVGNFTDFKIDLSNLDFSNIKVDLSNLNLGAGGASSPVGAGPIIPPTPVTPPAPAFPIRGTSAGTECQGTVKKRKLHNGRGGFYYETIAVNSLECGYTAPVDPPSPSLGLLFSGEEPTVPTRGGNSTAGTNGFGGNEGVRGSNQATIYFDDMRDPDEIAEAGASGDVGMNQAGPTRGLNIPIEESQVGNGVITTDSEGNLGLESEPINPISSGNNIITRPTGYSVNTLYGPYPDLCTAHAQKTSKGKITVMSDRDFGDVFEIDTFYSSISNSGGFTGGNNNPFGGDTFTAPSTEKRVYRGGNQFYYDSATGGVIQIGSTGAGGRFSTSDQSAEQCKPKIITGPHKLNFRFLFKKGNNHPPANSLVRRDTTASQSGMTTGGSENWSVILPYSNGVQKLGDYTAYVPGKVSTSVYSIWRRTVAGKHTIELRQGTKVLESRDFYDNSNKTPKTSLATFTLSFDYKVIPQPNYLIVNPGTLNTTSEKKRIGIEVKSTHAGTISGLPDWILSQTTFVADSDGGSNNFTFALAEAPTRLSADDKESRTATLTFTSSTGKTDTLVITQELKPYVVPRPTSYKAIITIENKAGANSPRTGVVVSDGVPEWNDSKWGETRQYPGYSIVLDASRTNELIVATLRGKSGSGSSTSIWQVTSQWDGSEFTIRTKKNGSVVETRIYEIKGSGTNSYAAPKGGNGTGNSNYLFTLSWDFAKAVVIVPDPFLIVTPPASNVNGKSGRAEFLVQSSSAVRVKSKPEWITLNGTISLDRKLPYAWNTNTTSNQRIGRIKFVNAEGLEDEIVVIQGAGEPIVVVPKYYNLQVRTTYSRGTNAPTRGEVNSQGAPLLSGNWGTSQSYTNNFSVSKSQTSYTTLSTFTASSGNRNSLDTYELQYRFRNGGFETKLINTTSTDSSNLVEEKFYDIGTGNNTVPQNGIDYSMSWRFSKVVVIDPPSPSPSSFSLSSNQQSVWATLEIFGNSSNRVVYTTEVASELSLSSGRIRDFIGSDSNGDDTYKVKVVLKSGFEVNSWEQIEPTNLNLDSSQLNRYIVIDASDTNYEWVFDVKKKVVVNENIDVYPTVNSIGYNTSESGDNTSIPYTSSQATSYVNVKLPNGQEIKRLSKSGSFLLKNEYFTQGLGRYTLIFCPYSANGDKGNEKTVVVNVVNRTEVYYPDIRDINWPKSIEGADFVGFDVPFSFTYKSVFTDYVKVYLNDKSTRIGGNFAKVDRVKLNVQDLVNMTGKYTESNGKYTFTFLLVPFGQQGTELLEGKTETIKVVFDKGDYTLDRNKVIEDLCNSFAANLDYAKFDEYTSKYLTHLLHFGESNNEIISSWAADTETFREYEIDPVTKRPTNKKKTDVGFDALVLKLYEPLETTVQPNQQVWITKIQSKPQLHEVIIRESSEESCPPLAGPNFSLVNNANMGYQLLDDMVAEGTDSNMKLVNTFISQSGIDTEKLDIQYVSGSVVYDKDSQSYISSSQKIEWRNFSHFGSAEERVKNFYYKLSLIENYENISSSLSLGSSSTSLSVVREREEQVLKIASLENAFDGFENFLYTDTGSLSWPKNSVGKPLSTGSSDVLNWLNVTETSAGLYDSENKNYLSNNIPQYLKTDRENNDFILFLDMIGHHFDILWTYVEALNRQRRLEHKLTNGVSDGMVKEMLKSFGYEPNTSLDTAPLWEFALGQYNSRNEARTDGTSKSVLTGKERQNQIWRRILNNLPYLYKSKGTSRGLKATLSTYGVPETFLSVREFGGPHPTNGSKQKLTTVEQTFAAKLGSDKRISIPWKPSSSNPQTIELSLQTEVKQDATIFQTDGMELKLFKDTGSLARFEFHISGSGNIISASTDTIPFFNDTYNTIMVRREYTLGNTHEKFDVFVKEPFQERIRAHVSASVSASYGDTSWESGSEITFGDYSASIDNIKLWRTALSESIFDEHVLSPDMYNGNSITSSTEDLYFRLDFEVPENFAESSSFSPSGSYKNTVPNLDLYGVTFATMSNFDSSSEYPYGGLSVIEKELTMTVPNSGLSDVNKIRIEKQTLLTELSPKARATKSALKEKPIDSNKIGMFISPTKNINLDIIKSMGSTFSIDDFIGDPRDIYEEEYTELKQFRKKFFSKYTLNYDAFYNLIKYVDNSMFQALKGQAPSRSKVVTGLLIEPHILERNKRQRKKPSGIIFEGLVGKEDISKNSVIKISANDIPFEGFLTASNLQRPSGEQQGLETSLDYNFVENLSGSNNSFETTMNYDFTENLKGSQVNYDGTLDYNFVNNFKASSGTYETIVKSNVTPKFRDVKTDASDSNNMSIIFEVSSSLSGFTSGEYDESNIIPSQDSEITKLGYGITAKDGHSIVTFLTPNGRDKERRKYYLVTEQVTRRVKVLNISGDQSSGYKTEDTTKNIKKVSYTSISGSAPQVNGNIISVEPINGNLPSHYIYARDTSTGLENSFFKGCKQTQDTTIDGGPAFETFVTNPNTLKVSDSGRGSGEPILEVE